MPCRLKRFSSRPQSARRCGALKVGTLPICSYSIRTWRETRPRIANSLRGSTEATDAFGIRQELLLGVGSLRALKAIRASLPVFCT